MVYSGTSFGGIGAGGNGVPQQKFCLIPPKECLGGGNSFFLLKIVEITPKQENVESEGIQSNDKSIIH